jgi:hypothetical protein
MAERNALPYLKFFLLISLLLIWGSLAFKIYRKYFKKPDVQPKSSSSYSPKKNHNNDEEEYSLSLNYQDPFNNNISSSETENEHNVSSVVPSPIPVPPEPIQFPMIEYKGFIRLKNGQPAALISSKNKTFNWHFGEEIENASLVSIWEDSIVINYLGHFRTYRKNQ